MRGCNRRVHPVVKLVRRHVLLHPVECVPQVEGLVSRDVWNHRVAVLLAQVEAAVHQVAERVSEVRVVEILDVGLGVWQVVAVGSRADEEEAHRVGAVLLDLRSRVDNVAKRLAHLLAVLVVDEAVAVHRLRKRNPSRHKHGRPDDSVKPEDVLPDDVAVGWPEIFSLSVGACCLEAKLFAAYSAQVVR